LLFAMYLRDEKESWMPRVANSNMEGLIFLYRRLAYVKIMARQSEGYYTQQKLKLLRDFDEAFAEGGRRILVSHFGDELADTILKETREEYEALIPEIPYVGGENNIWTSNLIQCTWSLALYRALKIHGKTAEEAGRISYEGVEAQLYSQPEKQRSLFGMRMFSEIGLQMLKEAAAKSQKRIYSEDWVWSFVEGNGMEFDFGTDITECAICKFFHVQGAEELAPYMCRMDFATSKAYGMGLVRTMTIAEGGKKCDFRYKRGRGAKINF